MCGACRCRGRRRWRPSCSALGTSSTSSARSPRTSSSARSGPSSRDSTGHARLAFSTTARSSRIRRADGWSCNRSGTFAHSRVTRVPSCGRAPGRCTRTASVTASRLRSHERSRKAPRPDRSLRRLQRRGAAASPARGLDDRSAHDGHPLGRAQLDRAAGALARGARARVVDSLDASLARRTGPRGALLRLSPRCLELRPGSARRGVAARRDAVRRAHPRNGLHPVRRGAGRVGWTLDGLHAPGSLPLSEVLYRSCLWLGGALSRAGLSDGRWVRGAGCAWYGKRRRRYAGLLVPGGNAVFRLTGHHQRMLGSRAWVAREEELYRHAYGAPIAQLGRRLLLPVLPGRPVAGLLRRSDLDRGQKLTVVRAAARALHRLHRLVVPAADRIARSFSHADATVFNVLYDEGTGLARWVDFETVHAASLNDTMRRAEDLRALAYSAAACLAADEYDLVPAALTAGYPERCVLGALCSLVRTGTSITLPLRLAAVPPTLAALRTFAAALIRHVEEWTSQESR